jgi:hypothetical protein
MADLKEACADLTRELETEVDELASEVAAEAANAFPEWMREPPVDRQIFSFVRGSLLAEIAAFRGDRLPAEIPDVDRSGVRDAARGGTPLPALLRGYRATHRALWRSWSRLVEERALPEPTAEELRRRGSEFFFAYADRISELIAAEYAAERGRTLRSTEKGRVDAICAVLDGDDEGAKRLDHPVTGYNLALVGAGPDRPPEPVIESEQFADRVELNNARKGGPGREVHIAVQAKKIGLEITLGQRRVGSRPAPGNINARQRTRGQ